MIVTQQTTNSNTPAILTSAGTAISSNTARTYWNIQNLGTNPLFVRLGASASSTVFNYVLKGGTGSDDGLGGSISSDSVCYTGDISVAGTSPRYVITEIAA
jgi:hypothetical protein